MPTNLNVVTGFVYDHRDELITKASLDAKTLRYVEIMPNVKWKDVLNYLDSEVEFQDGSQCGFNPNGSDTFSDKEIETKAVKVEKSWCYKDWEKAAQNYQIQWEAGRIKIPFEEKISDSNLGKIQEGVEELVWQGNSGLSIDGYLKQITELESGSTIAASGITTASTIVDKIDAVVEALPQRALKKGVNIFVSYTDFRAYVKALNATCCANRPIQDAAVEELDYLGDSRVKIIPVSGLEGTGHIVAAPEDALVYATDIENSENQYKMWENEETEKVNFRVLFRAGTALKFPDEIVYA